MTKKGFLAVSVGLLVAILLGLYIVRHRNRPTEVIAANVESVYLDAREADPSRAICVVFVHGIFGDDTTWGEGKTTLPRLLKSDPRLSSSLDIFLFEYSSPWLGNANRISDLAEQLRGALRDHQVWDHKVVIFVAHSMGGLVVREYLRNHQEHLSQVPMMYFYAVPTNGAAVTEVASRISGNPQLEGMLPLQGNDFLTSITNGWMGSEQLKHLKTYCAFEGLPTHGVWIVPRESALALCTESADPLTADHIQIVKPADRTDPKFTRLLTAINDSVPAGELPIDPSMSGQDAYLRGQEEWVPVVPGKKPDYVAALKFFQYAAAHGNGLSTANVGWIYENGLGLNHPDCSQAMLWYQKAYNSGYARASWNIGRLYDRGCSVTQDYKEARRWYEIAKSQDMPEAIRDLKVLDDAGR